MSSPPFIRDDRFRNLSDLQVPLNNALQDLHEKVVTTQANVGTPVLIVGPIRVVNETNIPGDGTPWPLKLNEIKGNIRGVMVVRAKNVKTPGLNGTTFDPVTVTDWDVQGGQVAVSLVTGLATGQTYELTFAVFYE